MLCAVFQAANNTGELLSCVSETGVNWEGNYPVFQRGTAPSMAALNGEELFLGFLSWDKEYQLLIAKSRDGVNWEGNYPMHQQSNNGLALSTFNGQLFAAFRANDGTGRILTCTSPDGVHWSDNRIVDGQYTENVPALTEMHGRLYMVFAESGFNGELAICTSDDGIHWSKNVQLGATAASVPSLTTLEDQIFLAFRGNFYLDWKDEVQQALWVWRSHDGINWDKNTNLGGIDSKNNPVIAAYRNQLYLAWIPQQESGYPLYVRSSFDGAEWYSSVPIAGQLGYSVAMAGLLT